MAPRARCRPFTPSAPPPPPHTHTHPPSRSDDGSLWFDNNHNFQVYGHQKFKVGAIRVFGAVMAYVSDFAGHWGAPGEEGRRSNAMWGNKVIFQQQGKPGVYHDCTWRGAFAFSNELYSADGVAITGGSCPAQKAYSLAEWQALSAQNDQGSTFNATMPTGAEIVAWGEALLM